MAAYENPTKDLVEALDQINLVLAHLDAQTVSDLVPLRVRVMRPLTAHLAELDRQSAKLKLGSDSEKAMAKMIESEVGALRQLVNSHIMHWTPAAIAKDLPSYKDASDNPAKHAPYGVTVSVQLVLPSPRQLCRLGVMVHHVTTRFQRHVDASRASQQKSACNQIETYFQ